jgi:hypothetical protein
VFASAGCTRVKDFRDPELQDWKGLSALGVSFHPTNRQNKDLIIANIPWNPATSNSRSQVGDWVNKKEAHMNVSPEWVYQITEATQTTANAKEFRKSSPAGRIQAISTQNISIPLEGYEPVRVLAQDGHGTTLRPAKDLLLLGKKPPSIGFSKLVSSLTSRGTPEIGIGRKCKTWETPPSSAILPREGTKTPGKSSTPPTSPPSSNV